MQHSLNEQKIVIYYTWHKNCHYSANCLFVVVDNFRSARCGTVTAELLKTQVFCYVTPPQTGTMLQTFRHGVTSQQTRIFRLPGSWSKSEVAVHKSSVMLTLISDLFYFLRLQMEASIGNLFLPKSLKLSYLDSLIQTTNSTGFVKTRSVLFIYHYASVLILAEHFRHQRRRGMLTGQSTFSFP